MLTKVRSLFVLGIICFFALISGLACRQEVGTSTAAVPVKPRKSEKKTASNSVPSKPKFLFDAPQFELTDQNGQTFSSSELTGKVWIANFIFTHCTATCPRQTEKLAQLQSRIAHWPHADRVRFLSITVDPLRDTPTRLLEYATQHQANLQRWTFLTGEREDLWRLSKEGFKLPVAENALDSNAPITHSSRFALIDAKGRVVGFYESLKEEAVAKLLIDMQHALAEPVANVSQPVIVGEPADIFDPAWLDSRRAAQLAQAESIEAFHDFHFENKIEQSGITFVDRPVADVAKEFKQNHYDHANGIAAGDVDGDGLIDLYFTSQRGGNQLWRNLGGGRFADITQAAGVGLTDRVSVAASFADTDNDGDLDLFVTTTRHGNALFINDGQGHFEDQSKVSGLDYQGHSSGADFFDYDRDGLLDLLVTNVGKFTTDEVGYSDPEKKESPYYIGAKTSFAGHLFPSLSERSILYHNEGSNQFRDVSKEVGFDHDAWSGDATPIDANNDSWTDLYVLNMQGNDIYYENVEGKRFVERSREMFPYSVWGGMGVKSFDYNNDGKMDLYVTNMHADMWQLTSNVLGAEAEKKRAPASATPASYLQSRIPGKDILGSGLFMAVAAGGYKEIATQVNADNYWPWGPSIADLNADGFQDIFVASCMNYPFRYHVNSVLLNDGGQTFRDAEFILGVEPRQSGGTAVPWFELDASGVDSAHPLAKGWSGKVSVWGAVGTRSAVIFDLDGDGDLDIVTNDFNSPPMVLASNLAAKNPAMHYLALKLQGTKSNRDGLGAKVTVRVGDRELTQVHDGQSGYLSQSALPLYFGLGPSEAVDRVTIQWPSGKQQVIEGPIQANQTLPVTEG
jgi:cytochrome oxidase Cu insertion factor (SCO1/SenC/PrrC family)